MSPLRRKYEREKIRKECAKQSGITDHHTTEKRLVEKLQRIIQSRSKLGDIRLRIYKVEWRGHLGCL